MSYWLAGQTEPHARLSRSRCKYRHPQHLGASLLPSEAEVERHHRHHRIAFKYDDSYIWHAFACGLQSLRNTHQTWWVFNTATSFLPPSEKRPARALLMWRSTSCFFVNGWTRWFSVNPIFMRSRQGCLYRHFLALTTQQSQATLCSTFYGLFFTSAWWPRYANQLFGTVAPACSAIILVLSLSSTSGYLERSL